MDEKEEAKSGAPDPGGFDERYRELHQMAGRLFRSQRASPTLQATALVHEAYLEMAGRARRRTAPHRGSGSVPHGEAVHGP